MIICAYCIWPSCLQATECYSTMCFIRSYSDMYSIQKLEAATCTFETILYVHRLSKKLTSGTLCNNFNKCDPMLIFAANSCQRILDLPCLWIVRFDKTRYQLKLFLRQLFINCSFPCAVTPEFPNSHQCSFRCFCNYSQYSSCSHFVVNSFSNLIFQAYANSHSTKFLNDPRINGYGFLNTV